MSHQQKIFEAAARAVIEGNDGEAARLTREALAMGIPAKTVLDQGLLAGMDVVGVQFRDGDMFLPEVLLAARAMKAGMALLQPELARAKVKSAGKVLIGTVKGDLHDIGKNIVIYMLEGAGFTVIDLGINIPTDAFAAAVQEHQPDILGMSAFLTTTMPAMKEVILDLQEKGLRNQLNVILGGAPVSEKYALEIGADAFAADASAAVDVCRKMVKA